jgi:glycosyltransferase involved in cell wall biosynthesis
MKVAVVTEFYPRAADPVLGVWAHRQALAARDAGADVRVIVLHRPVPPRAALQARDRRAIAAPLRQPQRSRIDGVEVRYAPFVAPPRWRSYARWGAWAAPSAGLALRHLRRQFRFDLIHAHYAVPAGEAVRLARLDVPVVVSEHGGDVFEVAPGSAQGRRAVQRAFAHARLVLANSEAIARRCRELGAWPVRVVHLGTDLPATPADPPERPTITTVAHLVARKRHADVIRAVWLLRDRHPELRYVVIGDGPERHALESLAAELGLDGRIEFRGQLPPADAAQAGREATVFAMPSVDEAFGVAYVEAMAGGVPAIGCRGEDGPEEIAAAGGGIRLVPPGDVEALAAEIDGLLSDPEWHREVAHDARATVHDAFTWARCGAATVDAYTSVLR